MPATAFICPTCGTHFGSGGCTHAPPPLGGSPPPPPPPPPPAAPGPSVLLTGAVTNAPPTATAPRDQGLYVGAQVVPEGPFRIATLGFGRSGKTTYLGMLYFLLAAGRLPGYRFAWSDSLRDLEGIRAQLLRPPAQGGPTFPPRTDTQRTTFLHLGLRRWGDERYVDTYFPELSGEDVARIWSDGRFPENLHFLREFNGYLVCLDCTATGPMDVGRHLSLLSGLIELKGGGPRLEAPVAVLLTKWDLLQAREDAPASAEEWFKRRLGGLWQAWSGQLRRFRVFGVSAVGSVRTLTGHDGLPITRDGEPVLVPAPERVAGAPGEEASFHYKPLNLSRPLLWLLDQLDPGAGDGSERA